MARTTRVKTKAVSKPDYRSISYRDFEIRLDSMGIFWVVNEEGKVIEVDDRAAAHELIDTILAPESVTKSRRTTRVGDRVLSEDKPVREPQIYSNGSLRNPPENCSHVKLDSDKQRWCDLVICHFSCKDRSCSEAIQKLIKQNRRSHTISQED